MSFPGWSIKKALCVAVTDQIADAAAVRLSIERAHFDFPDAQRNDFFSHAAFNGGWKISPPSSIDTFFWPGCRNLFFFFPCCLLRFLGNRRFLVRGISFFPSLFPSRSAALRQEEGMKMRECPMPIFGLQYKSSSFSRGKIKDHKKTKEHRRHMRGKP